MGSTDSNADKTKHLHLRLVFIVFFKLVKLLAFWLSSIFLFCVCVCVCVYGGKYKCDLYTISFTVNL